MVKHNINRHNSIWFKLSLGLLAAAAAVATAATTSLPVLHSSSRNTAILSHTACLLEDDGHTAPIADAALLSRTAHYLFEMGSVQHWSKNVVRVYLDGDEAKRKPEETKQLVERAASLWNDQVGAVIRFEWSDTPDNTDVVIRFAPASTLPPRAVGKTDTQYRPADRTLLHADITLADGMKDDRLVQVAAHEMGHALGIAGHSRSSADLMFPIAHTPARVTERDRNTMCLNYQASPVPHPFAASTLPDTTPVR